MKASKYLTDAHFNAALPKEVAAVYKVSGLGKRTSVHFIHPEFGRIDFRTMTLQLAEFLIKKGADFLIKKPSEKKNAN